jgi:PAS domain S-box-containing protein
MIPDSVEAEIDAVKQDLAAASQRVQSGEHGPELVKVLGRLGAALEGLQQHAEDLRVQTEELLDNRKSLEAESQRYQTLFEFAPDGYVVTDVRGVMREVNRAASALLGLGREMLLGKPLVLFVPPEEQQAFRNRLGRLPAEGEARGWDLTIQPRKGEPIHVMIDVAVLSASARTPANLHWMIRDISERKRGEEALKRREEHFRLILESSLDAVVTINEQGTIIGWNRQAESVFGWKRHEAVGRSLAGLIIPEQYREAHRRGLEHFLRTGEGPLLGKRLELTALRRGGQEFPIELAVSPLRSGDHFEFSAFVRDITERKRLEARFRATVESAPAAMVMVNSVGSIVLVNAEAEKLFGYAREELLGRRVEALIPERFRGEHPRLRSLFSATPETRRMGAGRDLFGVRKDGAEVPIEVGLSPVEIEEGLFVLAAIVDITDRKRAEDTLRRQHQWDEALTTIGRAVTSRMALEEVLMWGLEAICRAAGATLGLVRLVDLQTRDLVAVAHRGIPPDYLARAQRIPWGTELAGAVAASGQPRVVGRPEEFPEFSDRSLLAGWAQSAACFPLKAGDRLLGTLILGHSRAEAFKPDEVQVVLPAVSMLADAVLVEQLRAAAVQEAQEKTLLFRELDHRVRNNLAALISLLHLGAEGTDGLAAARLEEMAERVARLADVHNLLTGRGLQPIVLSELAKLIAGNVLEALPGKTRIQWQVTGDPVRVAPSRVTAIALMLNELLTNCVKHAFPGRATGRVHIQVGQEGEQVVLTVQDDGVGGGRATAPGGLGMSIVQTLVTQSLGGTVGIAGEGGTRVTIRFPQPEASGGG